MFRKGLSEVVTAVLMILLVIAAVFIIWAVLRPTIVETLEDIEAQCLSTTLDITKVCNNSDGTLNISIMREATGGPDKIDGLAVVIDGTRNDSYIVPIGKTDELKPLESVKINAGLNSVADADSSLEVAVIIGDNICNAQEYTGAIEAKC